MNKIVAILLVINLGYCISFAQKRTVKYINVAKDTLEINATKDTLEIKNKINVTTDSTFHLFVVPYDTVHYNLKMQDTYKNTFKFKHDAFRERMKEPWLGDILKNIFFR